MNTQEQEAILTISLLAAFADSNKDEVEHAALRRVAAGFNMDSIDLAAAYQRVLTKEANLGEAVGNLSSPESKDLAYEMARCICEANGPAVASEQEFLSGLSALLAASGNAVPAYVVETSLLPPAESSGADALEPVLLRYAVLTAALELLPQTAGSLAIIPVQMKLVYDIGKRHGLELDRDALRDFSAALGIGAVSQVLDAGLRRLVSGVMGGLGGTTGEKAGQVTGGVAGTALTFATTYALGAVAERYYASGRKLDRAMLKEEFTKLVATARTTGTRYGAEITAKATDLTAKFKGMDIGKVLSGLLQGRL